MAPTCVLLKREIFFEHDASASGGASVGGAGQKSTRRARSSEEGEEGEDGSMRSARTREGSMRRSRTREGSMRRVRGDDLVLCERTRDEAEVPSLRARSREGSMSSVRYSGRGDDLVRCEKTREEAEEPIRAIRGARSRIGRTREESMCGASAGPSRVRGASRTVKVPSSQDIREAILDYLQSVKPDAHFANPPELSSLRLLRPTKSIPQLCEDIISVFIASADKNLVALYAGPYCPGTNLEGGYMIYDTSKNSLSTIPQPPYDHSRADLGLGAVVVCFKEGKEDTYLLAELTKIRGCGPPEAALSMWQPSAGEWVVMVASFPPELCSPNFVFEADMCFSYRGSILCWVDLLKGMVICDLMLIIDGCPEFHFIPLPGECMAYDRFEHPWRPDEFRSIACAGGIIKFVTMDGYGQRRGNDLSLTIWTLSTDLCGWNKVNEYFVRDIWASEAYLQSGLPNILPLFPVLSMDEGDVIYLVVTRRKVVGGKVEYIGQYLLSVDMQHHKVSYCPQNTDQIHSQLFASQCSAYLQRLEDHQGKVKARKVKADKDYGLTNLRVNRGHRLAVTS